MTEMTSSPIQQRTVARQTSEPSNPLDGFLWINPEGGDLGNNVERYLYNGGTGSWELLDSTGPDTPLYAAAGASWTDTGNGTVKNYRAGAWQNVGVTDHANLSNVTAAQHHPESFVPAADKAQYPSASDVYDATQASHNHSGSYWHDTGINLNFDVSGEACIKWTWRHYQTNNNDTTRYRLRNESSGFVIGPSGEFTNGSWQYDTLYQDVGRDASSGAWAVEIWASGTYTGTTYIENNEVWSGMKDSEVA